METGVEHHHRLTPDEIEQAGKRVRGRSAEFGVIAVAQVDDAAIDANRGHGQHLRGAAIQAAGFDVDQHVAGFVVRAFQVGFGRVLPALDRAAGFA